MVERRDVEAALEARRELGREYEPEIVDAFLEKVERRIDERLGERPPAPAASHRFDLRLPLGSMAIGIAVTAVATSEAHGFGGVLITVVAWIAIALINVAYALRP